MMEILSEQRLAAGNPVLANLVRTAHDKMLTATGKGFRVAECYRTFAQSAIDYARGRTTPGPKVSNAAPGYSWHNFAMAVDCYPFLEGDAGKLDWNPSDPEFQSMVRYLKAEGLVWGGDWHSIKDYPHFQLGYIPNTPTAEDRFVLHAGGPKAVWDKYGTK